MTYKKNFFFGGSKDYILKDKIEKINDVYKDYDFTFIDDIDYNTLYKKMHNHMWNNFAYVDYDIIINSILRGIRYKETYENKKSNKYTWFCNILYNEVKYIKGRKVIEISYDKVKEDSVPLIETMDKSITQLDNDVNKDLDRLDRVLELINNDDRFYLIKLRVNEKLDYSELSERINRPMHFIKNHLRNQRILLDDLTKNPED